MHYTVIGLMNSNLIHQVIFTAAVNMLSNCKIEVLRMESGIHNAELIGIGIKKPAPWWEQASLYCANFNLVNINK